MSTEIWVAIIGAVSLVAVAAIGRPGRETRRKVREVHQSTVNSHDTDLRHDVDMLKDDVAFIKKFIVKLVPDAKE